MSRRRAAVLLATTSTLLTMTFAAPALAGKPCNGCVGNADGKAPKGQTVGDKNAGYECDRNNGVGKGNPAHSGCEVTTTTVAPTTSSTVAPTTSTTVAPTTTSTTEAPSTTTTEAPLPTTTSTTEAPQPTTTTTEAPQPMTTTTSTPPMTFPEDEL